MARIAAGDGIKVVVATPHLKDVFEANAYVDLHEKVSQLQDLVDQDGLDLQVKIGMETHVEPELSVRLKKGIAYTLDQSPFVLVEFPFLLYPSYLDEALFNIQLAGYRPIIAHPERQTTMQRNPNLLAALVERGMLTQITAGSLLGSFGPEAKRASETFLRRNLVHVIASDAHRPHGHRVPLLSPAVLAAVSIVGEERAHNMVNNIPIAILAGEEVKVEADLHRGKKRLFGIW